MACRAMHTQMSHSSESRARGRGARAAMRVREAACFHVELLHCIRSRRGAACACDARSAGAMVRVASMRRPGEPMCGAEEDRANASRAYRGLMIASRDMLRGLSLLQPSRGIVSRAERQSRQKAVMCGNGVVSAAAARCMRDEVRGKEACAHDCSAAEAAARLPSTSLCCARQAPLSPASPPCSLPPDYRRDAAHAPRALSRLPARLRSAAARYTRLRGCAPKRTCYAPMLCPYETLPLHAVAIAAMMRACATYDVLFYDISPRGAASAVYAAQMSAEAAEVRLACAA